MKKVVIIFLCFTISLVCFGQIQTKSKCAKELNSNQILKLESVPFNQTMTEENISLLKKFIEYGIKNYPEMQTWKVDFKIRKSETLIIDVYGFLDRDKINNLICSLKKNNTFNLPKKTIILLHELDSGKAIFGMETIN
jgi:hypothetical protein